MPKLNISQAARAVGIARITVQRHIKQGRLSCEVNTHGKKLIDTSELTRVYGELKSDGASDTVQQMSSKLHEDTPDTVLQSATELHQVAPESTQLLQQKVGILEANLQAIERERDDLKKQRETAEDREKELRELIKQQQETINKQTLLLPAPEEAGKREQDLIGIIRQQQVALAEEQGKRKQGFWARLFRMSQTPNQNTSQTAKTAQDTPIQSPPTNFPA